MALLAVEKPEHKVLELVNLDLDSLILLICSIAFWEVILIANSNLRWVSPWL